MAIYHRMFEVIRLQKLEMPAAGKEACRSLSF